VGHLARLLEGAGIATVIIAARAFRRRLEAMTLPRVLITPHLMGRPLGAPGDHETQQLAVVTALQLLQHAEDVGAVTELSGAHSAVGPRES
jgi:hypothetical protein